MVGSLPYPKILDQGEPLAYLVHASYEEKKYYNLDNRYQNHKTYFVTDAKSNNCAWTLAWPTYLRLG